MKHILSSPGLHQVRRTKSHTGNLPAQPSEGERKDQRWHLLDLVRNCRSRLGLRDRDVTVLRGLLSLMPAKAAPHQRVVFASNRVLTERCDGIDERTLRRRIAHLQSKGLLTRKQSPNGKRYQVRDDRQDACLTYGIDLSPLFLLEAHLQALVEDCRRETIRISTLRAQIRDCLYRMPDRTCEDLRCEAKLALRRSLTSVQLENLADRLFELLSEKPEPLAVDGISAIKPASDGQNDRHILRSDKEYFDSEGAETQQHIRQQAPAISREPEKQDISLSECLDLVPTAREMAPALPQSWEDVIALTASLGTAIGLTQPSLRRAQSRLGRHGCALAVLGLVEAFDRIQNPEAYLRVLGDQAQRKTLNLVRMFRSLVRAPKPGLQLA